ncbi:helix-turn-helix domain-containing protein [Paludibacterium yongneupense]|uniref:helix-turn-helix domain-containing protein n=1 Tax=Paludibacterium yongneupense TaxID=400061 RepID=UPI0004147505|nr:helix-turn-helix domain-containing protein [Paludibacterium yongneupense]
MGQQSEQNNQPAPNPSAEEQQIPEAPAAVSVGAELRTAREAAGLGLSEVADRLKLSLRQLEAIERDDFDSLPGATFVRGFVRNYARFLELDPAPLMAALEGHFPSAVHDVANLVRDEPVAQHEPAADKRIPASRWLVVGLVGVVLGATAIWVFGHREEGGQDSANGGGLPMTQAQPAASEPVASSMPLSLSASAAMASAPVLETSAPAVAPLAAAAAKPAVKPVASLPVATSASAPLAAGQARVTVSTEEEAWVSIVDANGKKLVFSNLQPGDARDASGTPPFKVRLGNAEKVTLTFNGKPVNFADRIKGTVANIDLK